MAYDSKAYAQYFYRVIFGPILLLMVLFIAFVAYWAEQAAIAQSEENIQRTLDFQSETLLKSLEKYSLLANLLARRDDVKNVVKSNSFISKENFYNSLSNKVSRLNQFATIAAGLSGVNDVWITDDQGRVVASKDPSVVDDYISDQEYFIAAMEGRLGRSSQFDESGQRYYVISSPIFDQGIILGAVIVRVNLEFIENVLALIEDKVLITLSDELVFLSNEKSWRLNYLFSTKDNLVGSIKSVIDDVSKISSDKPSIKIKNPKGHPNTEFYVASVYIPLLGWDLTVLKSSESVVSQRNLAILICSLITGIFLLCLCFWVERQERVLHDQRSQQAFSLRLERQVRDRTKELSQANELLTSEIQEREAVEKDLRKTQDELMQSAKLAGIGQMSTALAHEYNQPLAAIHSYAENAIALLQKSRKDEVEDNLERIKLLTHKMAELTKSLKSFSFKSKQEKQRVDLSLVMDEVMILMSPQSKKESVELDFHYPEEPVFVLADKGRMSQVLVNLISNALFALKDTPDPKVNVFWTLNETNVEVRVVDNGPGVEENILKDIFSPFFTTKSSGQGLGLGLFIVAHIVNDHEGKITIQKGKEKGAIFQIIFPMVKQS